MPRSTAKTRHELRSSPRVTLPSSSTVMALGAGFDADAAKSVACVHRQRSDASAKHPHPSKACVSTRQ